MNGFFTVLAIMPFICVASIGLTTGNLYLQYGSLGLCAILVVFLCNHIKRLTNEIIGRGKLFGELNEKNTKAYDRLANLLEDRPCLMKNQRIKEE